MSGFDQATENLYSGSNASVNTSYRPESTAVSPKTNRCPTTSRVTFAIHDKIEPTNQRWTRNFYTTTHTNWPGLDKIPDLERMLGDLPEFHVIARTVEELDVKDGGKTLEVARSLNKGLDAITSAIRAIDPDVRVDRYYVDDNNGTIERMDGDDHAGEERLGELIREEYPSIATYHSNPCFTDIASLDNFSTGTAKSGTINSPTATQKSKRGLEI
jgi:hypothetical protein